MFWLHFQAQDLATLMRQMEHWGHRLFPKMPFDEVIERVEKLGSKKEVQTCIKKIRLDMPVLDNDFVGSDQDDEDVIRRGEEEAEKVCIVWFVDLQMSLTSNLLVAFVFATSTDYDQFASVVIIIFVFEMSARLFGINVFLIRLLPKQAVYKKKKGFCGINCLCRMHTIDFFH